MADQSAPVITPALRRAPSMTANTCGPAFLQCAVHHTCIFGSKLLICSVALCSEVLNLQSTKMNLQDFERFVDADEAARFLSLTRRRVLELARAGKLPGHPIGDGPRRVWRFRLSDLAAAFVAKPSAVFTYSAVDSIRVVKPVPGAIE